MGLDSAARNALVNCMGLKKKESCLILYDAPRKELALAFFEEAKKTAKETKLLEMPVLEHHGQEPSKEIAGEIADYDVVMIVTTKSLSHTDARRNACKKGARIASMPGLTREMMERALAVDYKDIKRLTSKLAGLLNKTKRVRIETEKGSNLILELNPKTAEQDDGFMLGKGSFGNLPAGEAGLAPKTANGTVIIDGAMSGLGIVEKPFKIVFKDGYAVGIESPELKTTLEQYRDKDVYHIGEFAIGCNPNARLTGNVLEDEKVMGTCHIALGDNTSYKGGSVKAPCHLDGIIKSPTIYFDDKLVMDRGRLCAW